MKQKFLSIALFFCAITLQLLAQEPPVSDLVFDKLVHDFGDIFLSDGPQSCTFTFTNKGSKSVVIQIVTASCGCTDPQWDKAPIAPGKRGTIKVTFKNDQGPYPFDKTMAVYHSASEDPVALRIHGVVHDKKRSLSEIYPVAYGNLRLQQSKFHLGQIAQGEVKSDSVQVVNGGKNTLEVNFANVSKGLIISVNPKKIKAGEKGYLRYTIDTRIQPDWGHISYTARPLVIGANADAVPIEVSAIILDNFSHLTKEQLDNAPVFLADSMYAHFGETKKGNKVVKTFVIANKGKSPLVFHKANPSNIYTTVEMPKEIAPDKSGTITVTLDTANLSGEVTTGVTIVTNVFKRPIISLMVAGIVVP